MFRGSEFKVFGGAVVDGGVVRALRARGDFPRSRIDRLEEKAKSLGAKGLAWAVVEADGWRSPIAKFLSDDEMRSAGEALDAKEGDAILIVADRAEVAARALGSRRVEVSDVEPEGHDLFWVTDFPMFGWNEGESRWDPMHHPFTSPTGGSGSRSSISAMSSAARSSRCSAARSRAEAWCELCAPAATSRAAASTR